MNDELGTRIKDQYENRTRHSLPRRTYTIIRVDGKAFHTLTRGFNRPFDAYLMFTMDETAKAMCAGIQGAKFAYVQSDEISILLTDFEKITSDAWFDGNIQKMASVSASMATVNFNKAMKECGYGDTEAMFDSRVFTIPDMAEVANYFIWRQNDASRNSVNMVAQSLYSHKELQGHSCNQMQEMIFQKGKNWNDYTTGEKRGRIVIKEAYEILNPNGPGTVTRSRWVSLDGLSKQREIPIFTQDTEFLKNLIPKLNF